jgi:hypothetical protein
MKNLESILAENMRRFNTKNLSEQAMSQSGPMPLNMSNALTQSQPMTLLNFANDKIATAFYLSQDRGATAAGTLALDADQIYAANLGENKYLVIGRIGQMTPDNTINNPKPEAVLISTSPSTMDSAAAPHKIMLRYGVKDSAGLAAKVALAIGGQPQDKQWFDRHVGILKQLFSAATQVGLVYDEPTFDEQTAKLIF